MAIEILERARHREGLGPEAIKSLVDLYARRGRFDLVCRWARTRLSSHVALRAERDPPGVDNASSRSRSFRSATAIA